MRRAGALENPEVIPLLVNAEVPFRHAAYLLSKAGRLNWPILESEIRRVAALYQSEKGDNNTYLDPLNRSAFYSDHNRLSREEMVHQNESEANLEPYLQLAKLGDHDRLQEWQFTTNADGTALNQTFRSASTLFSLWESQNITIDQQRWISRFMIEGFDQAWARDVVVSDAQDRARLQVWFEDRGYTDLSARLDGPMKAAVARWLGDAGIGNELLQLVPMMIECRLSVDQIDAILRSASTSESESESALPSAPIAMTAATAMETPTSALWRINLFRLFIRAIPLIAYGLLSADELFSEAGKLHAPLPSWARHPLGRNDISKLRYAMSDTLDHLPPVPPAAENRSSRAGAGRPERPPLRSPGERLAQRHLDAERIAATGTGIPYRRVSRTGRRDAIASARRSCRSRIDICRRRHAPPFRNARIA